eukprot:SAG11_NODE_290_length_11190_cov_12.004872_3_plen_221_part_00
MNEDKLLRQVLVREKMPKAGSILTDEALPEFNSMAELAHLAGNHETKEGKLLAADWGVMCAEVEGKSGHGLPTNTPEQTEQQLTVIGGDQIRGYTDGGFDGNGAGGIRGAAGWGAHIIERSRRSRAAVPAGATLAAGRAAVPNGATLAAGRAAAPAGATLAAGACRCPCWCDANQSRVVGTSGDRYRQHLVQWCSERHQQHWRDYRNRPGIAMAARCGQR